MSYPNVPVLMYHSVGKVDAKWIWNYLTVPIDIFIDQISTLKRKKYHTLNLSELYEYMQNGRRIPERSVILTFDDGYLDNWVYVYPVLKKYGFKATIFVSPEFVDPAPNLRSNLEDVWNGRIDLSELQSSGFLSWAEMRAMEKAGVIDIQSHAMSHTWYFASDEIVDFRYPGDEYIWMDWNDNQDQKYNYLNSNWNPNIKFGTPVYAFRKSLEGPRVFPSQKLSDLFSDFVNSNGKLDFFKNEDWRSRLFNKVKDISAENDYKCEIESENDFEMRLNYEIVDSKKSIEKELNKKVEFLCWPGGGICEKALLLAAEHYKAVTLPSSSKIYKKNRYGEESFDIKRIGVPGVFINDKIHFFGGRYLYSNLREFQGSRGHRKLRQLMKLSRLIVR